MPSFADMMMVRMDKEDATDTDGRPQLAPDIEAIRLRDSLAALNVRHEFRPGMIVRQKPQAINYEPYGDNDLAIVVAVLDTPITDAYLGEKWLGTQVYGQVMNMVIGSIQYEGDRDKFHVFHVDSRRFEPAPEEVG